MPVVINPESELGKEMAKWEKPYQYRPFPKMLYRAQKRSNGKVMCMAPAPSPFGWRDANEYNAAINEAESFTASCQRIVHDESEMRIAKGQGWCEGPDAAIAQFEREEQALGNAAAETAFAVQGMTDKAKRELREVDGLTHEHVTDVTGKTKKQLREQAQA